jgi:hypothetical protein
VSFSFLVLNTLYTEYFLNYQLKSVPFGVIQLSAFVAVDRGSVLVHTVIHHLQLLADHYLDDEFHSVVGIKKVVRSDPIGLIHLFGHKCQATPGILTDCFNPQDYILIIK